MNVSSAHVLLVSMCNFSGGSRAAESCGNGLMRSWAEGKASRFPVYCRINNICAALALARHCFSETNSWWMSNNLVAGNATLYTLICLFLGHESTWFIVKSWLLKPIWYKVKTGVEFSKRSWEFWRSGAGGMFELTLTLHSFTASHLCFIYLAVLVSEDF